MTCAKCGKTVNTKPTKGGGERLPQGWHRDPRDPPCAYCGDCWGGMYILRAITIPVVEPIGCSWVDLRAALSAMWCETTALSNWALTELWGSDVRRGSEAKMPAMERNYL